MLRALCEQLATFWAMDAFDAVSMKWMVYRRQE
jgi:hypothetical protein